MTPRKENYIVIRMNSKRLENSVIVGLRMSLEVELEGVRGGLAILQKTLIFSKRAIWVCSSLYTFNSCIVYV